MVSLTSEANYERIREFLGEMVSHKLFRWTDVEDTHVTMYGETYKQEEPAYILAKTWIDYKQVVVAKYRTYSVRVHVKVKPKNLKLTSDSMKQLDALLHRAFLSGIDYYKIEGSGRMTTLIIAFDITGIDLFEHVDSCSPCATLEGDSAYTFEPMLLELDEKSRDIAKLETESDK